MCRLPCVGRKPCDFFSNIRAEPSMQHETIIMGLCTDIPVRTLSVHCVTCHGPNILSAVFRIFWCSPLRSTAAFATCCMFSSHGNERPQASVRGGTTFCSTPRLLHTGKLQCHLHNPRCCLCVLYFILVISRIVRLPALLGVHYWGCTIGGALLGVQNPQ